MGVSELPPLQLVALAPNPVQDQAVLTFETLSAMDLSLILLDAKGSLLQTFFMGKNFGVGKQSEALHLRRDLPSGSYWLELLGASQPTMLKMLKK